MPIRTSLKLQCQERKKITLASLNSISIYNIWRVQMLMAKAKVCLLLCQNKPHLNGKIPLHTNSQGQTSEH